MLLLNEESVIDLTSYERLVFAPDVGSRCYLADVDTDDMVFVVLEGDYRLNHIDDAGAALLTRARDYGLDPGDLLTKHYGRKNWSTYIGTLHGSTQSEWCEVFVATNPDYCIDAHSDFKVLQQWFEGDVWGVRAERMVTRVNDGANLVRDWVEDDRYEPCWGFYPSDSADDDRTAYEACYLLDIPLPERLRRFEIPTKEVLK